MSPEEDRTLDAVDMEPKHYQLSYSGLPVLVFKVFTIATRELRVTAGPTADDLQIFVCCLMSQPRAKGDSEMYLFEQFHELQC